MLIMQQNSVSLGNELRIMVLKLYGEYYKPAEIQTVLKDEGFGDIPIEAIREVYHGPTFAAARNDARQRFNEEILDIPLASRGYRVKIINDLMNNLKQEDFKDTKDFIDSKCKLIDLARKEFDKKGKAEAPPEFGMFDKLLPQYKEQYLKGELTYPQVLEMIKKGEGYVLPVRP